jgi:hypothetical protein
VYLENRNGAGVRAVRSEAGHRASCEDPRTSAARDHPRGGEVFDQRQALIAGIAVTVLTLIGLVVAIPYWRMLGLLHP